MIFRLTLLNKAMDCSKKDYFIFCESWSSFEEIESKMKFNDFFWFKNGCFLLPFSNNAKWLLRRRRMVSFSVKVKWALKNCPRCPRRQKDLSREKEVRTKETLKIYLEQCQIFIINIIISDTNKLFLNNLWDEKCNQRRQEEKTKLKHFCLCTDLYR